MTTKPEVSEVKAERSQRKTAPIKRAHFRVNGDLEIPVDVENVYAEKGFKLCWVLAKDHATKTLNSARIASMMDVGAKLVTPEEMRDIFPAFLMGKQRFDFVDEFGFAGDERSSQKGVRHNDVVLMAVPLEYFEQKRQFVAEKTKAQIDSASIIAKNKGGKFKIKVDSGFVDTSKNEGFFT